MRLPDVDTLPFPMFVTDDTGAIARANRAWMDLLPEALGRHWSANFPDIDATAISEQSRAALEAGTALRFTSRIVLANGDSRWFDIRCQRAPSQAAAEPDGPAQMLGLLVDVTEPTRRQAELLAILETAVDAIIIIDEQGRIETFNQAAEKLFGYARADIIGKSVNLLMPEPHRSRHDAYMARYLTTGEKRIIGIGRELEAITRDGRLVPIHLSVSEILLEGRRRFTGIVRDRSEQAAAREVLAEQREKLAHVGRLSTMGEMTASIAHEINQPLTAISMYAQSSMRLIERGDPDLGKLATALEKLNTQSLRAGAIIERIQRFARAQESHRQIVALNALITELVKLAEADARLHDLRLRFDLDDSLPELYCDPIQIQQVALNLIRNAIDAMSEIDCANGDSIDIRTRRLPDGRVEVAVADQGPGVPDSQKHLVFTAFHTTKKEGMGMGLSICRSIITEHGGDLSYRNNPDAGATFYFTLPLRNPEHD